MCMLLLMDNLMENSNMVTLSMEPSKQTISLHIYLSPEMLKLLANQMLHVVLYRPKIIETILSTRYISSHHL